MQSRLPLSQARHNYRRVRKALCFIAAHSQEQPSLEDIARELKLSPSHFQKLFTRWTGISPKQFLSCLNVAQAKQALQESRSLLETSLEVGLSSPSRLHDLFIKMEAMTPGEFKAQGKNLTLHYGVHPTPLGQALLATTPRGICYFQFITSKDACSDVLTLAREWPQATLIFNPRVTAPLVRKIFSKEAVALHLKGTPFQLKVWQALLNIPAGHIVCYEDIAHLIQMPQAHRAVASAIAKNAVAYLIPCHRVIRKTGILGGYRWGSLRKQILLAYEKSLANQAINDEAFCSLIKIFPGFCLFSGYSALVSVCSTFNG